MSNIYHLEIKMRSKMDLWIIIVKQRAKEMGVSEMSFNQEPCTEWVPFANVIRIKDCFLKYKEAYPDKPSKSLTNLANTAQCTWLHVDVQFVFQGLYPFTAAPLAKTLQPYKWHIVMPQNFSKSMQYKFEHINYIQN